MKKIFILGTLLTATAAHADIPTLQYTLDFYERECGLPPGMGLAKFLQSRLDNMAGHPVSTNSIVSEFVPMFAVDAINGGTTYAQQLTSNDIVSVGYLKSSLDLIDSPLCCKGGLKYNPNTGECLVASGVCSPYAYVREETSCPTGWERVELSHASMVYERADDCDLLQTATLFSRYSDSDLGGCGMTILQSGEISTPVDVCLPPVDGDIVVTVGTTSSTNYWAIGENCVAADKDVICDVTQVKGYGYCASSGACTCYAKGLMTPAGADLLESGGYISKVFFRKYATSDECRANCAAACANAVQTLPGFRRALLLEQPGCLA